MIPTMHRVLGTIIPLLTLQGVLSNRTDLPGYRLQTKLFENYNKNVRPIKGVNDSATNVTITFNLQAFVDLDERQQTLRSAGVLYMQWNDRTLSWNPEEFGNIKTILVNQEEIWVPDINVGNTVIPTEQLGYERGPVLVESNGAITWQPHCVFDTLCSIDITYFPFDIQRCPIIIGSRQSVMEEVYVSAMKEGWIDLWGFRPNSQWQLLRVDFKVGQMDDLSRTELTFTIRRRPTKVVCNVFIPVIFLSVTANMVFLLPIDGGERMSTAVTILLAYAVYLTIVADSLPMNAKTISCLEMYLLLLLGLATMIAVANVVVVRFERKKGHVGARFAKCLKCIQPFMCLDLCDPRQKAKLKDIDLTHMDKTEAQEQILVSPQRGAVNNGIMSWSKAAKIIDRILFMGFLVATCLSSIIMFCVLSSQEEPENNIVNTPYPSASA